MILDKIEMHLKSDCHLSRKELSVVGVSGGPDSICLLHLLCHLGYHLVAVHVNHQLRTEAAREAQAVEKFARDLGIECISGTIDVISYANDMSLSVEEAARALRYKFLFAQAEQTDASAVLVAHNADDQVETLLLHFLRGSGLSGLRGMEYRTLPNPWNARIPLIRPLLSIWREEIMSYLAEYGLAYNSDQSNDDPIYLRNKVRHELIPYLEKYNPRIRHNLLQMSQINKDDYAVIQQQVDAVWETGRVRQGPGYIAFNLPLFQRLSHSLQRYYLRKAIAYHLPSLRDIDFDSIERGIRFLCAGSARGQSDLIAGLRLLKEGDLFWLASWQADLPGSDYPSIAAGKAQVIIIPSHAGLNDDWILIASVETNTKEALDQCSANADPFQAWLDLDALELPLVLRSRKPGERFHPLGMNGHSLKVSDLMVNLKMPKRVRASWPLVCSGENIVWIPGYRQGHLGRVQSGSRELAHLTLKRSSGA